MQGPNTFARALWALFALLFFVPTALAQTTMPGQPVPAEAQISDQKAGSVLFYNLYSSNMTCFEKENTRINLTNTSDKDSIAVHLFFVDGNTCSPADAFICLTPSGTISFLASDMDPGVMGFIVAVAVDEDGIPINFNYLIGDEYVKLTSGHMANLGAEAFSAIQPKPAWIDPSNPTRALLMFNDWHYSNAPRVLAVDYIPSIEDDVQTLLILNRFGGDLITGGRWVGSIFGILYNDLEIPFSFSFFGHCQIKQQLCNTFPRTVPNFSKAIPSGHSGWMRLWSVGAPDSDAPGLLGAVLYCKSPNNPCPVSQGHNLHKLTKTSAGEGYFVPIIRPHC